MIGILIHQMILIHLSANIEPTS